MGGSLQLLYLPENDATACLEVLRRVLQPHSKSLPHVTLRYSDKPLRPSAQDLYSQLQVEDLVLDQLATFDGDRTGEGLKTLVLLCDSEQLEHVSYKPDFPQSVFHITLYDGQPSLVAESVFQSLTEMPWGLKLNMTLERFSSSRDAVSSSTIHWRSGAWLTDGGDRVYSRATDALGLKGDLAEQSDGQKIALVRWLAEQLHQAPNVERSESTEERQYLRLPGFSDIGQVAFWSEEDIRSLSPSRRLSELDRTQRNSTYITPPELARDVVEEVQNWLNPDDLIDFGDPAIGSGIFYAALRRRLGAESINSARGVEVDVDSARKTLHRWRRTKLSVLLGDFTEVAPESNAWSLVLANPPYKRSHQLGSEIARLRNRLEIELDLSISARSDLYLYFVLRAHQWMQEGALAAWVLPAEFQVTDYARSLRTYLSKRVQLLRMHTFDAADLQFDNALTSTTVVIFRNSIPGNENRAVVSEGGTLMNPSRSRSELTRDLNVQSRWSFSFLASNVRRKEAAQTLVDFFEIKRGIATGANSLFTLTPAQVADLKVDRAWISPIFPRAKFIQSSTIEADSDGDPVPPQSLWLIDTEKSLFEIRQKSPSFADYLASIEERAQASALARRRHPVYRQDNRPSPPLAFVYMAKAVDEARPRFILNRSRAVVLNNYLALYPRKFFVRYLDETPGGLEDAHRSLNAIALEELRIQGRMYGRNLLKLEPSELGRVRLPNDDVWIRAAAIERA